jgi:dihydropteroate synthase
LNVTPDSFSDGGEFVDPEQAAHRVQQMLVEGADVIDVGAVSTRPGSVVVSASEEVRRLRPILSRLDPSCVCIDASSDKAVEFARACGVIRFNLCGGLRPMLKDFLQGATVIVYPSHGSCLPGDPVVERNAFFAEQVRLAREFEVGQLILDPGLGFGLSWSESVSVLRAYPSFRQFDCPLLVGVSRKNHLARLLGRDPKTTLFIQRIEAGLAASALAVLGGASYVRTHDVGQTRRFFDAMVALQQSEEEMRCL